MRHDQMALRCWVICLLSLAGLIAAEPTPPVVSTTMKNVTLALRAGWDHDTWKLNREDLTLHLEVAATAERPVLRLEILKLTQAVDGSGADLLHEDTNRSIGTAGRWWDPASADLMALTSTNYVQLRQPQGQPPMIRRVAGITRVFLANGVASVITVPIDGPQRQVPLEATGLSIEVGRVDWNQPALGLPRALIDRLASLTLQLNGRVQRAGGMNDGDVSVVTLPFEAVKGDTATFTVYAGVQVYEVPFTLGPIDLKPILGAGSPAAPSNF